MKGPSKVAMQPDSRIYVAGHSGMVGSAILRRLEGAGYDNLILRSLEELDLLDQEAASEFFSVERPEYVFLAAAKVGGILANDTYRADFIYENLVIATNVIHAAHKFRVNKLVNLGSSCIYPRLAPQPLKEEYLLTGPLEPTNEPYAIAKIAAIKLCENYRRQYGDLFVSLMPTNLYGPHDNFNPETSHVLPALIRKLHEGKINRAEAVTVWGSGRPRREFLHVDDLADACVFTMEKYEGESFLNVGCGTDIKISELAELVADIVEYDGRLEYDLSKPDGMPRKLLDASRLRALGWKPRISIRQGVASAYEWYLEHIANPTHAEAN